MYKLITLMTLFLAGGLTPLTAQNNNPRFEQIKAHKVAYLTERMDLTVEEAEKFWPLYNDYEQALEKIQEEARMTVRNPDEEEAKSILYSILDEAEKGIALKRDFYNKASKVVSYQKLYLMVRGEREFRVKILERYKNMNKRK